MADKLAAAEEVDEDDMFEMEARDFKAVEDDKDDGFEIQKDKELQDTIVIFDNNQFLLYDFKTNLSWQVGDLESSQGYTTIAEDASIVRVIPGRHRTNMMQAIVTGGIRQSAPSR